MFKTVAEIIMDRTGCAEEDIKVTSTFAELGIDSLDTVDLLMELEDATGVEVELTEKVTTIGELVELIEKTKKEKMADAV